MKLAFVLIKITFLLPLFFNSNTIEAQRSTEFIYGKVTTKSNEQFIGYIRWGKEEFLWHDVFNSQKVKDKRITSPSDDKPSSLWDNFEWNLSSIWEDKYSNTSHLFSCFFGDIKAIYPTSGEKLDLELKNGTIIKLNGQSNDVGATLNVYDFELGKVSIKWSKIRKVEFSNAPFGESTDFGQPIFGTLKTVRKGEFTGYIKWDLQERTTEDILDGDNGRNKVAFKNIKSIYKRQSGVDVVLNSDREMYLSGSNDVDSRNNGIGVYVQDLGNIEVDWKDFKSLHIHENPDLGLNYTDFISPKGMNCSISTYNEDEIEGLMVFDVDEKWEMEFIDGKDDDILYQIPFYNIKKIKPKNKSFSVVSLRNGEILLLGDAHDLSHNNNGVLLFKRTEDEPRHIKWRDIVEISLK